MKSPPVLSDIVKRGLVLIIITLSLLAPVRLSKAESLSRKNVLAVGFVKDDDGFQLDKFESLAKSEIRALLGSEYELKYRTLSSNSRSAEAAENIQKFAAHPDIDIIVALGFVSSNALLKSRPRPKPSIAANVLGGFLQSLPKNSKGGSGVKNFAYIESPYKPEGDLALFKKMYKIKRPAILMPRSIIDSFAITHDLAAGISGGGNFSIVAAEGGVRRTLSRLPSYSDAVYVFPLFQFSPSEIKELFRELNKRGLPSFAGADGQYLEMGATAGPGSQISIRRLSRRIALNILKISKGQKASLIPVQLKAELGFGVVNMESARKIRRFPSLEELDQARLINVAKFPAARTVGLRSVVIEALDDNLSLKVVAKDVEISDKKISLSGSSLFPQINVSAAGKRLSQSIVDSSLGQQGKCSTYGGLSLSQVILSEPLLADLAIKKLFRESRKSGRDQAELDVALEAAAAYINVLLAKSRLIIQRQNLEATRANLRIAKAKEKSGHAGPSDADRWESEFNIDKINVNNVWTLLLSTQYNLNQTLNRPIAEAFETQDADIEKILPFFDNELFSYLRRPESRRKLAVFLTGESRKNLPELKQMESAILARKRLKTSQKRAFFLPSISFNFQADRAFSRIGVPELPDFPAPNDKPGWSAAVSLSLPLFQGGKRKLEVEKTALEIGRLKAKESDLRKKLELRLLSNIDLTAVSLSEIELSERAFKAAERNFQTMRDAYSRDVVDATRLVDAQKAALRAEQLAVDAKHRFLINYLRLERSVGAFYFLAPKKDKKLFAQKFEKFLANSKTTGSQ